MIQKSRQLSNLLSLFTERINSKGQGINSNQFRIQKEGIFKPAKTFSNEAVTVELGKKNKYHAAEMVTYNNKAAYQKKNKVEQDKKEPPVVSDAPVRSKAEKTNSPEIKANAVDQAITKKTAPQAVAEKTVPAELPDFNALKQSQFKELQAAWGSKAGSDNYNESYDFNDDGVIDMVDYLQFGKEFNSAFEGLKQTWGTRSGEDAYANRFDYDNNGVIDMKDYLQFGKDWLA
ncbi:MAG: hypothetical protein K8R53_08740 [Bacteroidales bacterium]|nr:hypothetical protein [Bacteroidales bacterium]